MNNNKSQISSESSRYIQLTKFSRTAFTEFKKAFNALEKEGMEKLLFDLRNNPGGLLIQAIEILDMFISSKDTLLYTKGKNWSDNSLYKATVSKNDNEWYHNFLEKWEKISGVPIILNTSFSSIV